jgi:hypothetical protein
LSQGLFGIPVVQEERDGKAAAAIQRSPEKDRGGENC